METQSELNNLWTIAAKEFRDNLTSKRFLLMGILFLGIALLVTGVTVAIYGFEKGSPLSTGFQPTEVMKNIDSLNFMWVILVVVVTADMISAEKKDRTIYQLLSKHVERSTVILGKYLGYLGIIAIVFIPSSLAAYVLTAALTGVYPSGSNIVSTLEIIVLMLILFATYIAIGVLISTVTRNPIISILSAITVGMALYFSNAIGNILGNMASYTSQISQSIPVQDPFDLYPIYAKILVWIAPVSYDIVRPFLDGSLKNSGIPLWANVVVLLVMTGILLAASGILFNRQDL